MATDTHLQNRRLRANAENNTALDRFHSCAHSVRILTAGVRGSLPAPSGLARSMDTYYKLTEKGRDHEHPKS